MLEQGGTLSDTQKDWLSVTAILAVLTLRFYKTIFAGVSISKYFLKAHWDSLFYQLRSGQKFDMDCSICDLFVPYRFFVADYWHHGLPLWNQLSGLGMPLLADPQSFPFSPLYALFTLFPSMQTWNLLLILSLAIGGISVYFLCKELQLSRVPSLIASLLFIFCPYLQWDLELIGKDFCLVPLVFLFFTRMANKGSFWNIVLAGVSAAFIIICSHPEIAFVSVLFASIWTCFCCYVNDPYAMLSWLKVSAFRLAITGLIAFGLAAPILIPFSEYALNADCYKLQVNACAGLSWQAILANYLFPFQSKASIFFGPLSLWGLIAALLYSNKENRFARPLLIFLAISIICVIRPTPFNYLFSVPPLSITFATYWLPEYLLFMSIVSALGCHYLIQQLFDDSLIKDKKRIIALTALGAILLVIPFSYKPWHYDIANLVFDNTFEAPYFNWKVWASNVAFALVAIALLFSGIKQSEAWKTFGSTTFVLLGIAYLWILSLNSLPSRPWFSPPPANTLHFGPEEKTGRILSIGDHLFTPNTNLIYQLSSLRATNPIFPKGFIEFCKGCSARTDQYTQIFPATISPLLNLAGVNRIISEQPVVDQSILEQLPPDRISKPVNKNQADVDFENLVSLSNLKLLLDPKSHSIFLNAKVLLHSSENYKLCLSVSNAEGNPIAFSEPVTILSKPNNQEILCSALLPATENHWAVSLRVMREKDYGFLAPDKIAFGKILPNKSWLVATDDQSQRLIKIDNGQFQLLSQHGSILEYKNKNAFNRYFFAPVVNWVADNPAALDYLKNNKNQLNKIAVLEAQDHDQFAASLKNLTGKEETAFSTITKTNDTTVKSDTQKPTFQSNKSRKRRRGRHSQSAPTPEVDNTTNLPKVKDEKTSLPGPINFEPGTVTSISNPVETQPFSTSTDFSLVTNTSKPAFLVASDIYYPGWNVYIDGKQSNIFRADYLFRGIIIPAGKHTVRFAYQPISLTIGFWLFFITIETILLLGIKHQYWSKGKALTFKQNLPIKIQSI